MAQFLVYIFLHLFLTPNAQMVAAEPEAEQKALQMFNDLKAIAALPSNKKELSQQVVAQRITPLLQAHFAPNILSIHTLGVACARALKDDIMSSHCQDKDTLLQTVDLMCCIFAAQKLFAVLGRMENARITITGFETVPPFIRVLHTIKTETPPDSKGVFDFTTKNNTIALRNYSLDNVSIDSLMYNCARSTVASPTTKKAPCAEHWQVLETVHTNIQPLIPLLSPEQQSAINNFVNFMKSKIS